MYLKNLTDHEKEIFFILQKNGPMSKNDILKMTSIKSSNLNIIIKSLQKAEILIESGQESSTGGRRPSLFDVNTNYKYLIGIDISRSRMIIVLTDIKMRILQKKAISNRHGNEMTGQEALDILCDAIQQILNERGLTSERVLGIGIGMVGPVNRETGTTGDAYNPFAIGWSNLPVQQIMQEKTGCNVYVDHGTCAAVLGEYLYGRGSQYSSVSFFSCGVGIRSTHISSGVVIRALNGTEDSFAHTSINPMGERCYCGKRGCVAAYASTPVIAENVRRRIKEGESSLLSGPVEKIEYLKIAKAAQEGDRICIDELVAAGTYFGMGLANYITLLNPALVVIGGRLAENSVLFYDAIVRSTMARLYKAEKTPVVFQRCGTFGENTMAHGAAAMYLEHYMGNPILS
jgi:predicted NBD/HSP70 family sugar kinase